MKNNKEYQNNKARSGSLLETLVIMSLADIFVSVIGIKNFSDLKGSIFCISIFTFSVGIYIIYRSRLENVYRKLTLIGLSDMFVILAAVEIKMIIVHYNLQIWLNIKQAYILIFLLTLSLITIYMLLFIHRNIKK